MYVIPILMTHYGTYSTVFPMQKVITYVRTYVRIKVCGYVLLTLQGWKPNFE